VATPVRDEGGEVTIRVFKRLDDLPLFATDGEIANAVVGLKRAEDWRRMVLPNMERITGFPPFDVVHGGRYTPAVRRFYDWRPGLTMLALPLGQDGPEDPESWSRRQRRGKVGVKG
jgi:hypothetical protein